MRKDVKLGFAIGGVLLAVLIVYVLVVPGGGDKRLTSATGGDASSQTAGGAGSGVSLEPVPPVPPPVTPSTTTESTNTGAVAQAPQSPPPAPPTTFNPPPSAPSARAAGGTDPFEQPKDEAVASANSKSRDVDWSKLLNDSQVLMVPEPTPAGGRAAAVTPPSSSSEQKADSTVATGSVPDITKPGPTPLDPPAARDAAQAKGDATAEAAPKAQSGEQPASTPPPSGDVAGPPAPPAPAEQQQQAPTVADSGNTTGDSSAAAAPTVHVVQAGESFSSISMTAYGNANLYAAIMRANPGVEPTRLRPGMKINIPPVSTAQPQSAVNTDVAQVTAAKVEPAIDPQTQYRVQAGDSLYGIAKKLYGRGDKSTKLYEANKQLIGEDMNNLKLGQVLTLPEPPTKLAASR